MAVLPKTKKRKAILAFCAFLVFLIASLVVLAFVPLGNDPHTPGVGPVSFELQQAKIEANNRLSSSSISSHASHGQMPVRRIAVINESDHLIMQRVASDVADQLRALAFTDTVDAFDSIQGIPQGSELYDQYLTLSAPQLKLTGLLMTGQDLDATIKANMSPTLFSSRSNYITTQDVPTFKLSYEATLEHNSTTTGYESANARHKLVAKNISDELSKSLSTALHDAVNKAGARLQLPINIVPDYEPVPETLATILDANWEKRLTGHGYAAPNLTVWSRTTTDTDAALIELIDPLIAAGWTGPTEAEEDKSFWHLRYTLGSDRVLDVFPASAGEPGSAQGGPVSIVIRYRQRMPDQTMARLVDELIAKNTDVAFKDLPPFLRLMTPTQKSTIVKRVVASPPKELSAAMAAAELLHEMEHADQALDLLGTIAIRYALESEGIDRSDVEELGQTITDNPDWEIPKPTVTQLDAAGFIALTQGEPFEFNTALNEPVFCYMMIDEAKSEFVMITACAVHATVPEGVYTLKVSYSNNDGMGVTRSSGTVHDPQRPWKDRHHVGFNNILFDARAEETGEDTFRITIQLDEYD